ncbi:MAG: sigma-70 family RNA polymerase sigma factor [Myxococcales bacterium]|jgi:RNA polymerase sigma-70 factor (ECF subfamily)
MHDEREAIEAQIRTAFDARDFERAATLAIEHYGPELLGFLVSHMGDADAAGDVFAQFSEDFWKTLPRFEWRCSVRTWAYKLARRAASQHRRREHKHDRNAPLTGASRLSQAVERVRTATVAYRRTDVKDRFQALRARLPEEDQTVLILRVDRRLSWLELAEVFLGDETIEPDALKKEAARLRKRFQLAKDRLKKMAEEEGLLGA